jgi:putative ABC transport system permease protein
VTKTALRSLLTRRMRTALTALAVVLGVAMVTGSYFVTDTMLSAANGLESASYKGVDAVVAARAAFKIDTNTGTSDLQPIPAALVPRVRSVPQVQEASGEITATAQLVGRDRKVIGGENGPTFGVGFDARSPAAASLSPFQLKAGRFPSGPGEVAIDAGTAQDKHYSVGDTIGATGRGPVKQFKVVGTATFGSVKSIGNATAAIFSLGEAQKLFKKPGQVDSILVKGRSGVADSELQAAIRGVVPASAEVQSATSQDRFDIGGLKDFVGILQKALLAFGGISLFVGAFIIFNTLSITVAQRTREFALLRTLGASRRQVLRSVVLEAIVIGAVASVIGIFVGLGLSKGLNAAFTAIGGDLPKTGTVVKLRTIIAALVVGIGVTTLAGLSPALRATRVAPVAALREGELPARPRSRVASVAAAITTVLGLIGLGYGMFAGGVSVGGRLASIGAGCLVLFFGVALLSRSVVRPLASFLGRPAERIAGAAGRLARENSMRNPGRTATTAAALMIGLALVTFVAVVGQGLRSSFGSSLDDQLDTSYVVTAKDGFSPFAPEAAQAAGTTKGVTVATDLKEDEVRAFGKTMTINAIDQATFGRVYKFNFTHGSAAGLRDPRAQTAVVTKRFAKDHHLSFGERFEVLSPNGARLHLGVVGIDDRPPFNPLGLANVTISSALFDRTFPTHRPRYLFIDTRNGPGAAQMQALKASLDPFPDAKLQTQAAYKKKAQKDIDSFLGLLYVLLALSVIVSLVGIVNTLVLAVFERTRELGMLRAVGMTRRQVRRMVRHESVIVALIGAGLGMAVGFFLAALVTAALSSEGITFSVPVGTLVAFVVVAILAGMAAAILPARRASRLKVLEALQYE